MTVDHENIALIDSTTFIMDGGLETTLIFENGYALPEFAAVPLLDQLPAGDGGVERTQAVTPNQHQLEVVTASVRPDHVALNAGVRGSHIERRHKCQKFFCRARSDDNQSAVR